MTRYERVWTAVTGCVSTAALVAAFHGWTPMVLLCSFLAAGVMGAVLVLPFVIERDAWVRPTLKAVPWSGLGTWWVMGLAHIAGVAGLAAGALCALAAPAAPAVYAAVATRLGLRGSDRPAGTIAEDALSPHHVTGMPAQAGPPADDPPLVVPDTMTDTDLCQAWRSSFVALERAESVESRARAVRLRALYLDVLERRAGAAVHAWLASGARAASDPGRYLLRFPPTPRS